jgi:hypothetical protein
MTEKTHRLTDCGPSSAVLDLERKLRKAAYNAGYRANHRERLNKLKREKKRTGRPTGRPRQLFLEVDSQVERRRLHSARQLLREGALRVIRGWRWESVRRSAAQVGAELSQSAYSDWFDHLDDEPMAPPGVDLSESLWGCSSRAMDGAPLRYRDVSAALKVRAP